MIQKIQNKNQTAIRETGCTIKQETGKIINRKLISKPISQMRRWDEILRDILNGK